MYFLSQFTKTFIIFLFPVSQLIQEHLIRIAPKETSCSYAFSLLIQLSLRNIPDRIPFGSLFEKGLSLGTGQCNVKSYNRYLRDLIISGRAKPSFVISHEISIEEAPVAYKKVRFCPKLCLFKNFGVLILPSSFP